MPTVSGTVTLVANTKSANQLADKVFRVIPRGAALRLMAVGSTSTVKTTLFVGGTLMVDDSLINLRATAPIEPDDIMMNYTRSPGGEIILTFLSPTADVVRWKVDVV